MVKLKRDYNREESFKKDLKAKKPKTRRRSKKTRRNKEEIEYNVINSIEDCPTFTR